METPISSKLGQYHILEEIGRGGMATVYKAYQPALDRYVAIKVLPQQLALDPAFVQRFLREARTAAKLNHPHIVTIHGVGQTDEAYFIVMEYLEGLSLADLLHQQGALPPHQVARIVTELASALDHAHGQGFIHRDVKPSNVLFGAGDTAKLADFGIVRAMEGTRLTQTGTLVGTPEYMSPEQAKGLGIDHRSDVYSLGVMAYEMLTGRVPFSGDTLAVLHAHVYEPPDLSPLPALLQGVLGQALAKDPRQRYGSAGAFAQGLERAMMGVEPGRRVTEPPTRMVTPQRTQRPAGVPAWVWGAGAAVVVIAFMFGFAGRHQLIPDHPPTSTPWVTATTATPVPPPTQASPTAHPASPTPDPRIPAREAVERFQNARSIAYRTWDTDPYYTVLADYALKSSLRTIAELRRAACRYYISDNGEMQFHYEEVSADRVVVLASRSETQRRVCTGLTNYTCYIFDGYYVVERTGDKWYITDKSVQNLTETSPCP